MERRRADRLVLDPGHLLGARRAGQYLEIPAAKVRVLTDYCGGGFGAKFGAGNYGVLAALLAKRAAAPVRLCLDRREEHLSVGNRPGSEQQVSLASGPDGKLTAIEVRGYGAGGQGPARASRVPRTTCMAPAQPSTPRSSTSLRTPDPSLRSARRDIPRAPLPSNKRWTSWLKSCGSIRWSCATATICTARKLERQRGAELFGWSRRQPV